MSFGPQLDNSLACGVKAALQSFNKILLLAEGVFMLNTPVGNAPLRKIYLELNHIHLTCKLILYTEDVKILLYF